MSDPVAVYGDGLYGDGGLYESNEGVAIEFVTDQEVQGHWISARLTYVATIIPGALESFRIYSIRALIAPDRQVIWTHNTDVDAVVNSERVALRLTHSGSEFITHQLQLIGSRKKHQKKG